MKKTDKAQHNYPFQWKCEHEVRGGINANRCITITKSVTEAEQITAQCGELLRNWMYVTTFGQMLYNIRPSHLEHFRQYTLTFNGQRGNIIPII